VFRGEAAGGFEVGGGEGERGLVEGDVGGEGAGAGGHVEVEGWGHFGGMCGFVDTVELFDGWNVVGGFVSVWGFIGVNVGEDTCSIRNYARD
jgi:hypothetical protein